VVTLVGVWHLPSIFLLREGAYLSCGDVTAGGVCGVGVCVCVGGGGRGAKITKHLCSDGFHDNTASWLNVGRGVGP